MGENVLEGQVKSFQKGRDRSLQGMAAPTLFDRPDIVSTVYTAAPVDGYSVAEGDRLEGHVAADGQSILLAKGHVCVGRIDGDGAKSLIESLRETGSPGVVTMKVTGVSTVSGYMKTVIAEEN